MAGCLIVVDYQVDFVTGSLGFPEAETIGPDIARRIERAREQGWDVVFTLDTHDAAYLDTHEGKNLPVVHCVRGTQGHQLASPVREQADEERDVFLEKDTFGSRDLLSFVREKGYDAVELCGLVADICVLANAAVVRTALPEAEVCVNASLTASPSKEKYLHALDMMESLQVYIKEQASDRD